MSSKKPTISIIVSTYNQPDALNLILFAFNEQDIDGFEVIVADDGSTEETKEVVELLKSKVNYNIKHVWHPDKGFRISTIRNKAVALANGEYLIFLDGDTVPNKSFIRKQKELAEKGYFVSSNRILLSPDLTEKILTNQLPIYRWSTWKWFYLFCQRKIDRFHSLIYLGGNKAFWRYSRKTKWKRARILAMWKKDFLRVNGFDESFHGWGSEDSDIVVRLIRHGVLRKEGRHAVLPAFHLYHHITSREHADINRKQLEEVLNSSRIKAKLGVDQYL